MTREEFEKELSKIVDETHEKVVNLVLKARQEELGWSVNDDKPVSYADDPNWQRKADGLAELAGWVYDRMAGRNRLHKRSMTKKIRKALGYYS